ncbi:MAG: flavodoxin-dependent (E)-4-hydroxy-3-methylbut-2-enyl-diphosphate synthase [Armatimonadota bacterium]
MIQRRKSRMVNVGGVGIGGDAPVALQSMCTTKTHDIDATVRQINELAEAGADIVRIAVPHHRDAEAIPEIRRQSPVPLVADIHFSHILALKAIEAGIDKLRLNPGNIRDPQKIREVVRAAKERMIPIRVGANAGSLDTERYGPPTPQAIVQSALDEVRILEEEGFHDIVISLKSFEVPTTIAAYRMMAELTDYPLHLGITEAGLPFEGTIRSCVGIGALLAMGIGDTIRVSLTADPVEEVRVGKQLLECLDLREGGITIVACPSCGRCDIDLHGTAEAVKERLQHIKTSRPLRVAVMGCVVNGPGEARMADVGLAGGGGVGLIFARGEQLGKVPESEMVDELVRHVERIAAAGDGEEPRKE